MRICQTSRLPDRSPMVRSEKEAGSSVSQRASAEAAFERSDWVQAKDILLELLKIDREHARALNLLREVQQIIRRQNRASEAGEITLCVLGPITNVAMAMVKAPDIAGKIAEIVWMAGAYFEVGNITPTAEFNVYVDPEAADVVVKSGVKLTMVPLDVTHRALATHERLDRFRALGNRSGAAVADMLNFSERFDLGKYGWVGAPLHDPCVIAYLLKPEMFVARHINVEIELSGTYTTGMTVADWWGVSKRPANVTYVRDLDADAFFSLLTERIGRLA